jgi:predicted flap endonuclease-1-like 5' DNA nuclease
MKSTISYVLVGLFAIWCVVASQWYLFGIKGLMADPAHFQPHETTTGIIEIIVILLITVLLGFGIAWFLRQSAIDEKEVTIQNFNQNVTHGSQREQELMAEVERAESTLASAKETFHNDFAAASRENDRLKEELASFQKELVEKKEELQTLRPKVQLADVELGRITMQFRQLEIQLKEAAQKNQELIQELGQIRLSKPTASTFPDKPAQRVKQQKDDLKLILGIGPKIEKKLNKLGVYTFEQITELTPEMIEQINTKLKSFPDRIERDDWMGQAKKILKERK